MEVKRVRLPWGRWEDQYFDSQNRLVRVHGSGGYWCILLYGDLGRVRRIESSSGLANTLH